MFENALPPLALWNLYSAVRGLETLNQSIFFLPVLVIPNILIELSVNAKLQQVHFQ